MHRRCAIVSDKQHGRSDDREIEGCGLVAITDRAQENREYVRTLLKKDQPEFAAMLERLERELVCLRCWDTMAGHDHGYVVMAGANTSPA
jgi:hypothetical protein